MASEIQVSASIAVSKNGASIAGSGSATIDMAGDQMISNVQSVGTSLETLQLGDVTTYGYLFLRNMDATNYITVSLTGSGEVFSRLLPGDITLLKTAPGQAISVQANTAACNLFVACAEL